MSDEPMKIERKKCIVGTLDGLERARLSLEMWSSRTKTQIEKNVVGQLQMKVKELIRQVNKFSIE